MRERSALPEFVLLLFHRRTRQQQESRIPTREMPVEVVVKQIDRKHNTTQHNATQHNATQHNTTQHNTHSTVQHSTTAHRITAHRGKSRHCTGQGTLQVMGGVSVKR
jgi:hypothetical protein